MEKKKDKYDRRNTYLQRQNLLVYKVILILFPMLLYCFTLSALEQGETKLAFPDKIKISGVVVDEAQQPVIGATVAAVNSNVGTFTDIDGKFELSVDANSTIKISYVGYIEQWIKVDRATTLKIVLVENLKELDEVVVVGYGTQKRIHMTGAVSAVGAKELTKAPMQNISNMLTGKVSGVTSIQQTGKPGADGTTIYVRGLNTFNWNDGGNSPTIIVDGVPRPMDYVNPNDVESISVLKDAAAAIYGVHGTNGVILITTKSGGEGPAKITYDGSFTATQNTAMPDFLNAREFMYYHNKARAMDGNTPLFSADIQNLVLSNDPNSIWGETDWINKIFRTGITQQHNISAAGGTDKTKYYASLGFMDQDGTLHNTNYTRYNMRVNLDVTVAKNLTFSANLAGLRTDTNYPGTVLNIQGEFDPIRQAINTAPVIKSEFQGYPTAWNGATYYKNGYASLMESGYKKATRWGLDSNFKLQYDFSGLTDILKGLKISMFGAYNYNNTTNSDYDKYFEMYYVNTTFDEGIHGNDGFSPGGGYAKSASWGDTYMYRPQLDYAREFGKDGKHFVGAMLAYEAQQNYSSTMTGTNRNYLSDDPVDLTLGTGNDDPATRSLVSGSHQTTGEQSLIGRLNYVFAKKYLAEVSFRQDGTYKFAPENRKAFFPSASLGWVVSSEEFFANALPAVDYLKVRASIGKSGNSNIPAWTYLNNFGLSKKSMVLGGAPITQLYTVNAFVYRNLYWENATLYNLGFDVDVWNKKLGVELDLFYKVNDDILETQSGLYPPSLGGYYPSYQNSGKVDNRGFEITLKHENRVNSDLFYSLSGNFSYAHNRVLKRAVADNYPNYRAKLGEPINYREGFIALGLFQTQEEIDNYPAAPSGSLHLGDIKYLDYNGDGIINSTGDYARIGYGDIPEINFSLNMNVSWKGFSAALLWQGVTHSDYQLSGVYQTGVTSSTVYTSTFPENGNSPSYRIKDAWTPENPDAKWPRLTTVANGNNAWQSTWWLINGEYLRLKNANVGYTLPAKILSKTPFSSVYIYLAGTNLLTLSHFKYVDPESPSVSNGYYPQQKTYSLGLKVSF
ncbi:SusC/RagA family TonB-linked outer membrane protein [Dysgonomonas reticulitermitis]